MFTSTHSSSAAPLTRRQRRLAAAGVAAVAVLLVGVGLGVASAQTQDAAADNQTISCPTVADKLPAIPAQSVDEVNRNLALLNTQIGEANRRLSTSKGQGGPNFVQNAILGPLADKRRSTIDRIAISIGRHAARPTGLDSLATCQLGGAAGKAEPTTVPAGQATAPAAGNGAVAGGNGAQAGGDASPGTIACPSVADKLPAIPAESQAEVTRNLALLDTQIAEANKRLVDTVGQGGPNFVQNAILGPLADKRKATLDRIALSIGRHAAAPTNLGGLATCQLKA